MDVFLTITTVVVNGVNKIDSMCSQNNSLFEAKENDYK